MTGHLNNQDSDKKIVYWGAGSVGKLCLEQYPEIEPAFFIDGRPDRSKVKGWKVLEPQYVSRWADIYIVISVEHYEEIKRFLEKKNLIENVDFENYRSFFNYDNCMTSESSIEELAHRKNELKNKCFIRAQFFGGRESERIRSFFRNYIGYQVVEKFVILNWQNEVNNHRLEQEFGCSVVRIVLPGHIQSKRDERDFSEKLTIQELNWINELRDTKDAGGEKGYLQEFIYFKKVFEIIEPRFMMIWSGWAWDCLMLEYFCKKLDVAFCYGEYGWIDGTLQFDSMGIAGRSELCQNVEVFQNTCDETDYGFLSQIWSSIGEMDQNKKLEETEIKSVDLLDFSKKTILLIGMGDSGMAINPESLFWKHNISSVVDGTMDAFRCLKDICLVNGWNLIFKPHPLEIPNEEYVKVDETDQIRMVVHSPIEKLIELADVVVSITSAADFKVPLMGKPIVQLGKNALSSLPCTYVANSRDDIELKICEAIKNGLTESQWDNFQKLMWIHLSTTHWDDMMPRNLRYGLTCKSSIFRKEVNL